MVGTGPNAVQSVTIAKLRQFYTDLKSAHWKVRQIKKHFVFIDYMIWTGQNAVQIVTIEELRRFTLIWIVRIGK